jgi:hypothetical protein
MFTVGEGGTVGCHWRGTLRVNCGTKGHDNGCLPPLTRPALDGFKVTKAVTNREEQSVGVAPGLKGRQGRRGDSMVGSGRMVHSDTYCACSVGLVRLLPRIKKASDGLRDRSRLMLRLGNLGRGTSLWRGPGDGGRMPWRWGLAELLPSIFSSMGAMAEISLSSELRGWMPLTVDMDDIRECPPDCEEDAYEERLLWLSENLCLGDLGLPDPEVSASLFRKLGLSRRSAAVLPAGIPTEKIRAALTRKQGAPTFSP